MITERRTSGRKVGGIFLIFLTCLITEPIIFSVVYNTQEY